MDGGKRVQLYATVLDDTTAKKKNSTVTDTKKNNIPEAIFFINQTNLLSDYEYAEYKWISTINNYQYLYNKFRRISSRRYL